MKKAFIEGSVYGILTALTGYVIVTQLGFSPTTLPILLYMYVISSIIITMKTETSLMSIPFLKRIVLVAEGEEMKLKRLLTGEEYKVRGEIEKI